MIQRFLEHFKRYLLLGALALIPAGATFYLFSYLYDRLDQSFERLLPSVFSQDSAWFSLGLLIFVLYLVGVIFSYILGQRAVKPMSRKIADIFPHVQNMTKELEIARQIHETIIPDSLSTAEFDVAVGYVPCNMIGGDFVQYHFRDSKKLIFIIGDVTGHGLPAALLTNRLHMEFDNQIQKGEQPGALMKGANAFIERAFKGTNMYFSAFCGLIDYGKMELIYSNCGHIPQYVYRKGEDKFIELTSHTTMLGLIELESGENMQSTMKLKGNDRLVLFTDGIPETVGAKQKRYGVDAFKNEIRTHANKTPSAFNKSFLSDLWQFTEHEYEDDVCLMTIEIKK